MEVGNFALPFVCKSGSVSVVARKSSVVGIGRTDGSSACLSRLLREIEGGWLHIDLL